MVNLSIRNFIMIGLIAMLFSLFVKVITAKYPIPVVTKLANAS